MSLQDQLSNDLKSAMKARDTVRVDTLRMVRAALQNARIARGEELADEDVAAVLDKEAKKRKEAAEAYAGGGREELAAKERAELAVLRDYLPEQLSEEALKAMVAAVVAETGATSRKDMGTVMKALVPRTRGRADGKLVSALVTAQLSQ